MLFLILAFGLFLVFLAKAPQEVVRAGLALMWVIMVAGCTASVASTLLAKF